MRISTAQMFNQSITSVLDRQSSTSKILEQLSSGKRVNTAGDDPVAAIGIDNLNQQNALVDQFMKNIDYANNRLSLTESKLGSAETLTVNFVNCDPLKLTTKQLNLIFSETYNRASQVYRRYFIPL